MNVLVLGSGAREHALAEKLAQSKSCEHIFVHPGNGGTERRGFASLNIGSEIDAIITSAQVNKVKLIIIGPEQWLAKGAADRLRQSGFLVVGPNQRAARLESSKAFAKQLMQRAGIPTAGFKITESPAELIRTACSFPCRSGFLTSSVKSPFPCVLKFDGLAAGKGVVIAQNKQDVEKFSHRVWAELEFGKESSQVLVEEYIPGQEMSYMGLCDGDTFVPLASATDYKRLYDGNSGPNTGGMGAISPSPFLDSALEIEINERIVNPLIAQLKKEDLPYRGVLYIGLMIRQGDPFVLEFNARFGDPETQAVLMRLEGDLLNILTRTAQGNLKKLPSLRWSSDSSVYIVAAAEGYPEKPRVGDVISGIENVREGSVFFAGVKKKSDFLVTAGGRVFGVGATGTTLEMARVKAYQALSSIQFSGMQYRKDIGMIGEE